MKPKNGCEMPTDGEHVATYYWFRKNSSDPEAMMPRVWPKDVQAGDRIVEVKADRRDGAGEVAVAEFTVTARMVVGGGAGP